MAALSLDGSAGGPSVVQAGSESVRHCFSVAGNLRSAVATLTAELVDYRLTHYAKTSIEKATQLKAGRFISKVSHSNGKPILLLPTV